MQVGNLYDNMSPSKPSHPEISSANSAKNIQIMIQNPNEVMTPLYCTANQLPKSTVNSSDAFVVHRNRRVLTANQRRSGARRTVITNQSLIAPLQRSPPVRASVKNLRDGFVGGVSLRRQPINLASGCTIISLHNKRRDQTATVPNSGSNSMRGNVLASRHDFNLLIASNSTPSHK